MASTAPEPTAARGEWQRANRVYLAWRIKELTARLNHALAAPPPSGGCQDFNEPIHAARQAAGACGKPPALDCLTALFGLGPVEQDILLLALLPDVDESAAGMAVEFRKRRPTPALAGRLRAAQAGSFEILDCLLPAAALRRFALVRSLPGADHGKWSISAPLAVDERIGAYLRGLNLREERLSQIVRPLEGGVEAPGHAQAVGEIAAMLAPEAAGWPNVRVASASRADALHAAHAAAARARLNLASLNLAMLAEHRAEWDELFPLLARESALNRTVYWLGNTGGETDSAVCATGDFTVRELEAPLIWFAAEAFGVETEARTVRLPRLGRRAQKQAWEAALSTTPNTVNGELDRIIQQFDLGPADIGRALALASSKASSRAAGGDSAPVSGKDLWEACRERTALRLDDLAQQIHPCFGWDDIVAPPGVLGQLREIGSQVEQRGHVYETWGFGEKLSRGRGITVLFAGSSGTGKTMAAEVLARHLGLDLYRIDLSGVMNKYIGETEKNLRRIFDAAERSAAILFFDEADALFGTRTQVRDSHDRYANIEVNYLLQRMEDYCGLAILATNRKQALDEAFLRRLRFTVDFPFPDAETRRRIWQKVFPAAAGLEDLDFSMLARLEVAGGNIRNIALNAAFQAAAAGSRIGMAQVMRSAAREFAKLEKGVTLAEFGQYAEAARK